MRAFNTLTGKDVAIKFTPRNTKEDTVMTSLQYETEVYKLLLDGIPGIPSVRYSGTDANHHVIVMDLLGPDLGAIRQACRGTFTLRTICMLADQMVRLKATSTAGAVLDKPLTHASSQLQRLEAIHSRGLVCCDIKPQNFAMGAPDKDPNTVYMFDFAHSKMFIDPETGKHLPFCERRHKKGTVRYASVPAHRRHGTSLNCARGIRPVQLLDFRGFATRRRRVSTLRPARVLPWVAAMVRHTHRRLACCYGNHD